MNGINKQWLSIRASAGSGKTFSLTLRYIYLLLLGAKPNEILTITFTNKAQNEMKERISNVLRELANTNNFIENDYFKALIELGLKSEFIVDNIKIAYNNFFIFNNHIMTFDAFFNAILRKFSFYVGLCNDYELLHKLNCEENIFDLSLSKLDSNDFNKLVNFCKNFNFQSNSFLSKLNQVKATNYTINKTKLPINFNDNFINEVNELQKYMLNFIFDKKGYKQLYKRFSKEISNININKAIELTIENMINIPEKFIAKLKKDNYDEAFVNSKIDSIKQYASIYFKYEEDNVINQFMKFFNNYKQERLRFVKANNKLSFQDTCELCYELLNNHIDKDFFYFRLDSKINHILVDEFQDTNIMQYLILQPLFKEIKSGIGRINNRSLFFVGDEKQAIYSFRGSDSRLFEVISKLLYMDTIYLPKNYRSAKNIVDFVNAQFHDKFGNYHNQVSNSTKDGYVEVITLDNKDEILDAIKNRIEILIKNNNKNIAILTRNNDTIKDIEYFLLKHFPKITISAQIDDSKNIEYLIILNALMYLHTENILYLKACFKLNGEVYNNSRIFNIVLSNNLVRTIYEIMGFFNLNSDISLFILEQSNLFNNIDDFITYLETSKLDLNDNNSDITIMSIHKSKGLEFNNVIIAEWHKNVIDNEHFYYDYEDLTLNKIHYIKNKKYREIVDKDFKSILDKRYNLQQMDKYSLLYVAFTRAKDSLYIINNKKNFLGCLNLVDCKIGKDIYQDDIVDSMEIKSPKLINQNDFGRQDNFIKDNNRIYSIIPRIKGIALHFALENYLKYNNKDDLEHILLNRFGLMLNKTENKAILKSVDKIINSLIEKNILQDNSIIKCEVSFLSKEKKIMRIDCLIENDNSFYILDYKSSNFDLDSKKKQISQYLDFINNNFNKNAIAYLCFIDGSLLQVS